MTRESALEELLRSFFSADELRKHLATEPEGEDLVDSLPLLGISQATLVSEAVQALKRRGLCDRAFFERLERVRRRRTVDIRKVRALWLRGAELDRDALWADGRYQLVEPCGSGGFGLVWKAIDNHAGVYVALKILHEQHADNRSIRQRFFRGAAALANLSHPSVVRVRSSVEQEGLRFFYVMELIEGKPLDALLGRCPDVELIGYLLQIGSALTYLHQHGLLHRDVKPSNILVTERGQAKLLDFDLVTGDGFVPITTRALGTALYSPPEAHTPDAKTPAYDVYSLARTALTVLRGREPRLDEVADPFLRLNLPEDIQSALQSALHPNPDQRMGSVATLCSALSRMSIDCERPPSSGIPFAAVRRSAQPKIVRTKQLRTGVIVWSAGLGIGALISLLVLFPSRDKLVPLMGFQSQAEASVSGHDEVAPFPSSLTGFRPVQPIEALEEPETAANASSAADTSRGSTSFSTNISNATRTRRGTKDLTETRDPVQLLEDARRANIAGDSTRAYFLASQSYEVDRNSTALALMGASACKMGDPFKARAVFKKIVDLNRQKQMITVCAERGIALE